MNTTLVYHAAWLAFAVLALAMGAYNLLEGVSTITAALLIIVGLLFGGRSVHALFIDEEPDEVATGRMWIAVAVVLVFILVIANQFVL